MHSLLRYIGGKHFLVDKLVDLVPQHRIYVEVFCGGGHLFFNKPRSQREVLNDIDGELVNLFMVLRDQGEALAERCAGIPYSRELYDTFRQEIRKDTGPEDGVERAARFAYILESAFAGGFYKGWGYSRQADRDRVHVWQDWPGRLEWFRRRLQGVAIDRSDFEVCLKNWDSPETFFYLDPPYTWRPEGQYRYEFQPWDHRRLRKTLEAVKGFWLLTYPDEPWVRQLYEGFPMRKLASPTTSAGITHRTEGVQRSPMAQLAITNYRPPLTLSSQLVESVAQGEILTEQAQEQKKKQPAIQILKQRIKGDLLLLVQAVQLRRVRPGEGYKETLIARDEDGNQLALTFHRDRREQKFHVDDIVQMSVEVTSQEPERIVPLIPRRHPQEGTGDEGRSPDLPG